MVYFYNPETGHIELLEGTAFNIDSTSSLEEIQNHFMPILTKLEENYDELFDQDTRVKMSDLDLLS